jgi:hypothetical protein
MFEKQIKRMKLLDFALTKMAVVAFVLFLVGIWPSLRNVILSVNSLYYLVVSLIAVIIVQARIWRK